VKVIYRADRIHLTAFFSDSLSSRLGVCIGCDFSSAKVVDRGVADRRAVDKRVADGCVADGRVFCKQDPRKEQRLAFGSLIDLNRRSRAAAIKIQRRGSPAARERWGKRFRSSRQTWGWLE
jgi:hypothetical protein